MVLAGVSSHDATVDAAAERRSNRAWWGAIGGVTLLVLVIEVLRWSDPEARRIGWGFAFAGEHPDALPFVPLLLLLPIFWLASGRRRSFPRQVAVNTRRDSRGLLHKESTGTCGLMHEPGASLDWWGCLLVGLCAFGMSWSVGQSFVDDQGADMPPAYHDEYSYLFQAETFLAGKTSVPSFSPRPELFDQVHVLNEGRFASRYFPGVGVWMLPFVAMGKPWLGHQVAAALTAMLMYWIGRDLAGRTAGLVAGLLVGVSPGLTLFSNLLLAHHPTLVGLALFLWCFLRMKHRGSVGWAIGAGVGLSFAMLCRPMTAAGFGLPFGLWFAWYLVRGNCTPGTSVVASTGKDSTANKSTMTEQGQVAQHHRRQRLRLALGLSMPLFFGFVVMLIYNASITGNPFDSPYQQYTDIYTPRHVYGFNNVVRGSQKLGPKVLENYDQWAENLDGTLATRNVWRRLVFSMRWTFGIVPLTLCLLLLVFSRGHLGATSPTGKQGAEETSVAARSLGLGDWWLVIASIVSLHLVHVPYWFEGIMGWHYVLESSLCWLLIVGGATQIAVQWFRETGSLAMRLWWVMFLGVAVLVNTVSLPLATSNRGTWWLWRSPLAEGVMQVRFSRTKYASIRHEVDALRGGRPCVVLVVGEPTDRHVDYVVNSPLLDAPVLWVRVPSGETDPQSLQLIASLFPTRDAILFVPSQNQLHPLMNQSNAQ
ncbi:MAG: glycosyltransferase family 39 protein [Planctomycetaceae bacterium]